MTQTISRLYADPSHAEAAVEALKKSGFGPDTIHVVAPRAALGDAEAAGTPDDGIVEAVILGGVTKAQAPAYADHVRRGQTLVSVRAYFGFARKAGDAMAAFSPTRTDIPDQDYELPPRDPAAPLSSFLGWRVLSDNPTPLSSFLRWPPLSAWRSPPKPDRALADNPAPFSKRIGMTVLSDIPAPLSARLGWRTLWGSAAPLSARLGWRPLSDSQAPLSKRLGWRLLLHSPAPLSALLGLRVLIDSAAPLSKRLGWRVS